MEGRGEKHRYRHGERKAREMGNIGQMERMKNEGAEQLKSTLDRVATSVVDRFKK